MCVSGDERKGTRAGRSTDKSEKGGGERSLPPFEYEGHTDTHCEAPQKQREIERAVRKRKRREAADPADKQSAQIRIRFLRQKQEGKSEDLNRRTGNTGVFAPLPERMSKKHVREVAKEFDISLKGVTINVDTDPEKMAEEYIFTGRTDARTIGRIDFFPKAFRSKKELVRTIYHKKVHVQQFKEYGSDYVQKDRGYFED